MSRALVARLFAGFVVIVAAVGALAADAGALASATAVSPNVTAQGVTNLTIHVTGSGFSSTGGAPQVTVSGTGVTVSNTTLVNSGQVDATISIDPAATPGARDVTVKQGVQGVDSSTCASCLTIDPRPTISGTSPSSASNTGTDPVTITGSNFANGATVKLTHGGQADIPGTSVTVTDSSHISATFDLTGQPPGFRWVLVVTNLDGGTNTFGDGSSTGFQIFGNTPTLTNVSPAALGQGATNQVLTLTGTNLARGATVSFTPSTGITVGSPTWVSLTQEQVTVSIASDAPASARDVKITNTDTTSATKVGGLTVDAHPTLTSVAPSALGQGATSQPVTINGGGFAGTPTVTVSGAGVSVTNVTPDATHPDTTLHATITVDPAAGTGQRDVTVVNPDFGTVTLPNGFTVDAAPTVSTVQPSSLGQGAASQTVTITGTGFQPGVAVAFSGTGITINSTNRVSATQLDVDLSVATNAPAGARDITITNTDAGNVVAHNAFAVGNGPTVTSLTPSTVGQNATGRTVVISGTNFAVGAVVEISGTGVSITNTSRDSSTQITITLSTTSVAPTGARDVTVTNPDAGTTTAVGALTVQAAPGNAAQPNPSSVGRGFTGNVVVTGSNFQSTPAVAFSSTGITVNNVTRDSATQLTVAITVDGAAPMTARDLTITNPDGGVGGCAACFTVNPGPSITSITPNGGASGGTVSITNLSGSGFANNAVVALQRNGQPDIPMNVTNRANDGTSIQGSFSLTSNGAPAAPGQWNVRVTNPTDGGSASLANGFTISSNAPSVSSVAPSAGGQGGSRTVQLTGTNFAAGAGVSVSGTGVTVSNVNVVSSTEIDATFAVASNATTSARDVTVQNTDGQSGTCAACFNVHAAPTVSSVAPTALGQGATNATVIVTGTGFTATPAVTVGGTGVTVTNVVRNSATQLTVTASVASNATTSARDVTVTNPDNGSATAVGALTIDQGPTVTSLAPNQLGQGATNATVVVTGTGFTATPAVTVGGTGVAVSSVVRDSSTQLTLTVTVNANATTSARDVTVTNPDSGATTATGALTIAAAPTITSVAPAALGQGATNASLVITGSNFVGTPVVAVSGSGVTVANVVRNSATQLTVTASVTFNAATGARDVTVTNPDKGVTTAAGALTIDQGPTVTSLNPNQLAQGATNASIVVTGTGFVATPVVSVSGSGVTVTNVVRNSATQLTVTASVTLHAATGARNVTVTNPDKGATTAVGALTINQSATGTSSNPFGSLDAAQPGPTQVTVAGWAIDPDTSSPIDVHVYVDGQGFALGPASLSRSDVGAAYPAYGDQHGFAATLTGIAPGAHNVCAYGINTGPGANNGIGCKSITVSSGSPFGSLDGAQGGPGQVTVGGWAIDPDTTAPIQVHVYADGAFLTATSAGASRPDVGAAFPGYGNGHGFGAVASLGPGTHNVCVYGINTGPGSNSVIGCRSVVVPSGSPFGSLDVAQGGTGQVTVAGWAIDPDTAASIDVHVYVDGNGFALGPAALTRNDVAAAYPGYGAAHGFSRVLTGVAPGSHTVCAYGINVGVGSNSGIGCRSVTVG